MPARAAQMESGEAQPAYLHMAAQHDALRDGPFDVVLCNPPYVPTPAEAVGEIIDSTSPACALDRRYRR